MFRRTRQMDRKPAATGDERRSHARHATDVQTVCQPLVGDVSLPARIRNVSQTGANLIISQPLTEGTMLRVNLPVSPGGPHTTVLACVMHNRETSPGEWTVGCVFSLELSADEMRLLGGEKTPSGPGDHRAWIRSPVRGTISYRHLPADDGAARIAELADLSPAGVGLILKEKLEPGTALTLNLRRTDGRPDRPMLSCVVYLTDRADGTWAAGCHFLRELTEKELRELSGA
jgi:PilZ domain-containing protein